jgi:hypothetical protein
MERYLFEIDILPLNPPIIDFLDPIQIHNLEVQPILCNILRLVQSSHECRYLILWSGDIPDNHMVHVGRQIRFIQRSHLLCLIHHH